jgi:hypothetical protein
MRRGTSLADPLVDHPYVLAWAQYALVAFELTSPLLLAPGRPSRAMLWGAGVFHLVTWAALKITFLPHVICLLAFLPLERLSQPLGAPRQSSEHRRLGVDAPHVL